jgi:hypothetical protein
MRSRITALAVALAAGTAAPSPAAAQSTVYQFDNGGTVTVGGRPSDTGCGLYICLTFAAGPVVQRGQVPDGPWLTGRDIFARAISLTFTPAFAQLNTPDFYWWRTGGFSYSFCEPHFADPGREICDRDLGGSPFEGGTRFPHPYGSPDLLGNWVSIGVPRVTTRASFEIRLDELVTFEAYDQNGRILARERFTPALVLTAPTVVPEPATLALTGAGLLAIAGYAMRRRA